MNVVAARPRRLWRTDLLDVLFVGVESIAWSMLITVFATLAEREFLVTLGDRLRAAGSADTIADSATIERTLAAIEAAQQVSYGPSWPLVALAGFGGFYLIRGVTRLGLEGATGALMVLSVTVLGLNAIAHLAIAGDLRLWDTSSVTGFMVDPAPYFVERIDLAAFVADPDLDGAHGAALGVTLGGLTLVWLRFAFAARRVVTLERVTRSFSLGFTAALIALVAAAMGDVDGMAPWVVVQFVAGVLSLAAGNHVRATAPSEGPVRAGPWLVAVGGTIGMLVVIAAVLGLSVLLNVGVVLDAVGGVALRVIEVAVIVVVTPIYWVLDWVLGLFLPDGMAGILDNLSQMRGDFGGLVGEDEERRQREFPGWATDGAKFLAVLLVGWVMYRVARSLLARRTAGEGPVVEVRGDAPSSGGLGAFLRDLFPRGGRRSHDQWERRHPAYLLWRRAERDGEERGFSRLPGETAIEFATRAERLMAAPFPGVAGVFDRLRYGRHEPQSESLVALDRSLTAWETATPATPELRERLMGAPPASSVSDIALRIETAKRNARGGPTPGDARPGRPPDMPI